MRRSLGAFCSLVLTLCIFMGYVSVDVAASGSTAGISDDYTWEKYSVKASTSYTEKHYTTSGTVNSPYYDYDKMAACYGSRSKPTGGSYSYSLSKLGSVSNYS